MDYLYDENGMLYGFIYNGAKYFYIRDTMQNILSIIDASGACIVQYNYSAYGECISVTGAMAGTVGEVNSFRYKGYYFDRETGFFYCKSRYYLPEWKRWLNSDNYTMLEMADVNKLNLFSYCANNPITNVDENGFKFFRIGTALDFAVTAVAAVAAIAVGTIVGAVVGTAVAAAEILPQFGKMPLRDALNAGYVAGCSAGVPSAFVSGIATFGAINNGVNAIYYNCFSDGESDLTTTSYHDRYLNRWERLDYTKDNSEEDSFNFNAWRYYSEYNLHMYGWGLLGWAHEKGYGIISDWAGSAEKADIVAGEKDKDWYVNVGTIILGILGL